MEQMFSPAEIIRIAVNVEKSGQKLFSLLEQKTADDQVKNIWRYLKDQEETHRQIFQQMLDETEEHVVEDYSPGEYSAYLRAIASEYIVTRDLIEKKITESFARDIDAVNFGIFIEKESILTYGALRDYVKPQKQKQIDNVIAEEKKHLVNLCSIKKNLLSR